MPSTNNYGVARYGDGGFHKSREDADQDPPMVMATALPTEFTCTIETVMIDDDLDPNFMAQETTPLVAVSYSSHQQRSTDTDGNPSHYEESDDLGSSRNEVRDGDARGEDEGPLFRDWFFALLFYAQFFTVIYTGIVYGSQGYENIDNRMNYTFVREQIELQLETQSDDFTQEDWDKFQSFVAQVTDYISVHALRIYLYTLIPGSLCAFFFSHTMIRFVVPQFSAAVVKLSLSLPVFLFVGLFGISIIALPTTFGSLFVASLLGAAVVYYVRLVWPKIPFAAVNLKVATIGINANMGTHLWAFVSFKLGTFWILFWLYATFGILSYMDDQCSEKSDAKIVDIVGGEHLDTRLLSGISMKEQGDETGDNCGQGRIFFLLLLSCYWTTKVFMNSLQVIVAGVMATWCFDKEAARGCCSPAVGSSIYRSATYSFGSICLGSLLQGIMQILRKIIPDPVSRRHNNDSSCCGLCFCIVECCGTVLEDVLDYFHQWSYVFIGIYGYGYIESGRRVLELFRSKGFISIISERLVSYVTGCITFTMGIFTGVTIWGFTVLVDCWHENSLTLSANDSDDSPSTYVYGVVPRHVSFFIGFALGAIASSVMMSVVRGGVNTLIVCFADSPARMEEEHPQLTKEILEAWAKSFPATFPATSQRNSLPTPTAEPVTTTAYT